MASISHKEITEKLANIIGTTTAETLVYDLLRIFSQTTETSIRRIIDGKGNKSKDGKTILVEKTSVYRQSIAYRPATSEDMQDELEQMKSDPKIQKVSPRLYVVSDGTTVIAYDPKEGEDYENSIDLLWKDYDFFMPLAGVEKNYKIEENEADVKASYRMAKIYDDIRRYNDFSTAEQTHGFNVFMTRLLFCFFAEDTSIFPVDSMFTDAIKTYTKADGSDLQHYLDKVFDMMSIEDTTVRTNTPKAIAQFPYVNGGLFNEHFPVPKMSRRTRDLIISCGNLNWSEINPDIFGSMIQAVISPEKRAGLGLHYTSVPNIMKVIMPLFLNDLEEEFAKERKDEKKLRSLLSRLSKIKFFDPACGSGNFLIIAYKEIRRLEIQIWQQLHEISGQGSLPFSNIKLTQFYGIEIDEFAQETATLSLWLAEHQMNKMFYDKLGTRPNALPLRASGHIVQGNACRLDWNVVCPHTPDDEVYVMGNPPYLGFKYQKEDHKHDKEIVFRKSKSYKMLDYVACWFYLGAIYSQNSRASLGFVSTNSICQGGHIALLWRPILDLGIEIFFAHTSFKWVNNAKYNAGIICIVIGLRQKQNGKKRIYTGESNVYSNVEHISPDLSDGQDIIVEKRSKPLSLLPKIILGSLPAEGGHLIMTESEKDDLLLNYPHISNFIMPFVGSNELINDMKRYCLLITSDEDVRLAYNIPELKQRFELCASARLQSKKKETREWAKKPWAFTENRYNNAPAFVIPVTSSGRRSYIPIAYTASQTVIYHSAFAIYDGQVWVFGVLTSKMHMAWVKTVGGKLKSDYRYSAQLCYNTFPFPRISDVQKQELENYAEEVLLARENHTEMTLAQMYDPDKMPQDLRDAHRELDLAVERCYRPESFHSDEERLEHLFKLYEKITKK